MCCACNDGCGAARKAALAAWRAAGEIVTDSDSSDDEDDETSGWPVIALVSFPLV